MSAADIEETIEQIAFDKKSYKKQAYHFVREALEYTVTRQPEPGHISGQQLAEGIRSLAQEKFGLLARMVFDQWGISRTRDFGEIVFHLVDAKVLMKNEGDSIEDFEEVYDFNEAFDIEIELV